MALGTRGRRAGDERLGSRKANMNLGAYEIFKAESVMQKPEWPELGSGT